MTIYSKMKVKVKNLKKEIQKENEDKEEKDEKAFDCQQKQDSEAY